MKIKKNDNVIVLAGKDRGKTGLVERVFPNDNKLVVRGVGIAKKHMKKSQKNPQGGIIEINQKIDASNVMIFCASCGKPSKIEMKSLENGNKIRICKKCNQSLEAGVK